LFHNSNVFGSCFIHILYTECAKIKKKSGAKTLRLVNNELQRTRKETAKSRFKYHLVTDLEELRGKKNPMREGGVAVEIRTRHHANHRFGDLQKLARWQFETCNKSHVKVAESEIRLPPLGECRAMYKFSKSRSRYFPS